MPPRKHDVDPTTQVSMLAPSPAALATDVMVELEDGSGYYRQPPTPPVELTPEQQALKDEANALYLLGRASDTKETIANMSKRLHTINTKEGYDSNPTEVRRLEDAIIKSDGHYSGFRLDAKKAFAKSIGVETVTVQEERTVEGTPRDVPVARAKNDEQDAELSQRYSKFFSVYGGPGVEKARNQRRRELLASIGEQADSSAE